MSLFKIEVLEQRGNRLHGEVVFTQPLSTKLFAGSLFGIVAIAGVWVSVGTIRADRDGSGYARDQRSKRQDCGAATWGG